MIIPTSPIRDFEDYSPKILKAMRAILKYHREHPEEVAEHERRMLIYANKRSIDEARLQAQLAWEKRDCRYLG